MKLQDVLESLPVIFDTKNFNSLSKKPKKLRKGVYGTGGGPVGLNIAHAANCPAGSSAGTSAGACTCGAGDSGGGSGGAGGGAGGGGGA